MGKRTRPGEFTVLNIGSPFQIGGIAEVTACHSFCFARPESSQRELFPFLVWELRAARFQG